MKLSNEQVALLSRVAKINNFKSWEAKSLDLTLDVNLSESEIDEATELLSKLYFEAHNVEALQELLDEVMPFVNWIKTHHSLSTGLHETMMRGFVVSNMAHIKKFKDKILREAAFVGTNKYGYYKEVTELPETEYGKLFFGEYIIFRVGKWYRLSEDYADIFYTYQDKTKDGAFLWGWVVDENKQASQLLFSPKQDLIAKNEEGNFVFMPMADMLYEVGVLMKNFGGGSLMSYTPAPDTIA